MTRFAWFLILTFSLGACLMARAEPSALAAPENGPRRVDPSWHALRNATIHTDSSHALDHATIILRDGLIQTILEGTPDGPAQLPLGPRVWDCTGLHIYPGFIDPYLPVDLPRGERRGPTDHWNSRVNPQRNAADGPGADEGLKGSLRSLGFTAAAITPRSGIFRGTAAVQSLRRDPESSAISHPTIYNSRAYHSIGFDLQPEDRDFGDWSGYPNSLMGAIALIRQTFMDVQWQSERRAAGEPIPANSLDCLVDTEKPALFVFDAQDNLDVLRSTKLGREFHRSVAVLGSGSEFERVEAIQKDNPWLLEPLRFPKQPDVSTPGDQESVELRTMMEWEHAPTNLARLHAAGLRICLTSAKIKDRGQFLEHVRLAIKAGLPAAAAFDMLTVKPAELLGVGSRMGTLAPAKVANLTVADGDIFAAGPPDPRSGQKWKPARIRDVWIEGDRHEITPAPAQEIQGTWDVTLSVDRTPRTLEIGTGNEISVTKAWEDAATNKDHAQPRKSKAEKVMFDGERLTFQFDHEPLGDTGVFVMSAAVKDGAMIGTGTRSDGRVFQWSAARHPAALAGSWSLVYDDPARQRETLIFDANNTLDMVDASDKHLTPTHLRFDGKTLSFTIVEPGISRGLLAEAALDAEATPRVLRGSTTNGESRTAWTATESVPTGTWRILEHDGAKDDPKRPTGLWITIAQQTVTLKFVMRSNAPDAAAEALKTVTIPAEEVKITGAVVNFKHPLKPLGGDGTSADTITIRGKDLTGQSTLSDGSRHAYSGERESTPKEYEDKDAWRLTSIPRELPHPFGPYGVLTAPPAQNLIIRHATIWTSSARGVITDGTLLVQDGRIKAILAASEPLPAGVGGNDWTEIDAQGRHITAGIIDCHSHTGISRGVNESGEAVTCEVRIEDVTNPDSISWYRQLAGGVTAVNSLHGSANAIGGQNCVNKIRWGCLHPDEMHFAGAIPGVKFALGENPKQSNYRFPTPRYPASRMGVEALIRDRFTAADEYRKDRAAGKPVRRDLELEALAEVLDGKRLVHAHSYRQDEILMLADVARDFGFKIGTYQHILEGYKVSEVIKRQAIGASAFADWWGYKVEVQDAIPQGPPLMAKQGVIVSYNSDSDEMARRLNSEAAKAMKYGGLSMEEALKFITINPAIQLKIEARVGSLEVGKDADFAIWSGPPLSSLSRCEATYIEGACMFSLTLDAAAQAAVAKERSRLIQKLLVGAAKKEHKPEDATPPAQADPKVREYYADLVRQGKLPDAAIPGVCGCGEGIQ